MSERLRVLIVEDQWMLADAFTLILEGESDIVLLPTVSDGLSALEACVESQPDVVLLDIDVPGMDGFTVAREIARTCVGVKIVMISALPDPPLMRRAAKAGARGLMSKQRAADDIAGVLRKAAAD